MTKGSFQTPKYEARNVSVADKLMKVRAVSLQGHRIDHCSAVFLKIFVDVSDSENDSSFYGEGALRLCAVSVHRTEAAARRKDAARSLLPPPRA